MQNAFSLVELAIVLVILGLLVGGVLAGRSLIRAAELRKLTTFIQQFDTAGHAFKDKYVSISGDITNATAFWGKNTTYCPSDPGNAATPGTCNGNGDGNITGVEYNTAFQQLVLAGLIQGYNGMNISATCFANHSCAQQVGVSNAIMIFYDNGPPLDDVYFIGIPYPASDGVTDWLDGFLHPSDLWSIDTKIDDGKPHMGKIGGEQGDLGLCAINGANPGYLNMVYNVGGSQSGIERSCNVMARISWQ